MTLTITVLIQAKLTKNKLKNRYKIYKHLKKLLQLLGKTQFMHLTQKYYTLNYHNFKEVSEFLDHVKHSEEQISITDIVMTPNKQTLLYLTKALWNKPYY